VIKIFKLAKGNSQHFFVFVKCEQEISKKAL